jgi:predicted NAD/FAD-dependent oxidoreductase
MRNRVIGLAPRENRSKDGSAGWAVETQSQIADFDHVIMATEAREAARLVRPWQASWADTAESLGFEPIITVWLKAPGAEPWTFPMMALHSNAESPAQFAFDCGALGGPSHTYAFVVSAAAAWVAQGLEKTAHAVVRQAQDAFNSLSNARGFHDAEVLEMRAIKRATFACLPGLKRPISFIRPGLLAAGDYIDGPYPATLEGAVRSGKEAATLIL